MLFSSSTICHKLLSNSCHWFGYHQQGWREFNPLNSPYLYHCILIIYLKELKYLFIKFFSNYTKLLIKKSSSKKGICGITEIYIYNFRLNYKSISMSNNLTRSARSVAAEDFLGVNGEGVGGGEKLKNVKCVLHSLWRQGVKVIIV